MQGQTVEKTVVRIRVRWLPSVIAGAGLALTVFGLTPAQATPPGDTGTHQAYACRYEGNPLTLASGTNPILIDIAAATTSQGIQSGHLVVLINTTDRLNPAPTVADCPGYTPPTSSTTTGPTVTASGSSTTSSTTSTTTGPTVTASGSSTTSSTTSTTTGPTVTSSASSTTSSTSTTTQPTGSASSTTSSTTQPTVTASGSATSTHPVSAPPVAHPVAAAPVAHPVSAAPVAHSAAAAKPSAATSHAASDPLANTVPLAATDGADLAGTPTQSPRDGMLASGLLLLMAAGVLSTRRSNAQ